MALNSDVTVTLTGAVSSGTVSDGIPLFLAANTVVNGESEAAVPYTECTTLSDVVSAGFSTDSTLYKAVQLMRSQTNKPKTFAVYGSTAETAAEAVSEILHEDWRQLITVALGSSETIKDVAAVIEAADDKTYFTSISIDGADDMTDAEFAQAWLAAVDGMEVYDRTIIMYYDDSVQVPEAALVGATAALDAGSFTYKNIILSGISALTLSESRVNTISGDDDTAHALTVVKKAGDIVTTDGMTAGGEWIDVVDSYDWIIRHIEYNTQKVLNTNDKVPYTDAGVTLLENATLSVLKTAFENGMIAESEDNDTTGDYSTDFTAASDMTSEQRATRHYDGGNFTFRLAGAIHTVEINGTIEA